jgi:hypothetical protein
MRIGRKVRAKKRWALIVLILLGAGAARAQDGDLVQHIYAEVQDRIRAEYEFNLAEVTRQVLRSGQPVSKVEPFKERMKILAYNKAALFASCVAEAEKDRQPNAARVPLGRNLMVTTCVEVKLARLQKFSGLSAYADFFFPERIVSCGESLRMPELERMLKPYDFLFLDEPKLYDFERYNECLMKH